MNDLPKLPLAQRQAFCERLLADQIDCWTVLWKEPPLLVIAKDQTVTAINSEGKEVSLV